MKRILIVFICMVSTSLSAQVKYGNMVTISRPVYEDLYIAAGTVIINAPVHGDLVVAGGTININDTVTNDILLAGGNITFNGYAGDDIRCAGGTLHISKNVSGDVVITGGTIVIDKGVTIGGLVAGGGDITVNGIVAGNIRATAGKLTLNGIVQKKLDCRGANITINGQVQGPAVIAANSRLIVGNNASFMSNVRYWAPVKIVDFKRSLKGTTAQYDPTLRIEKEQWYFLGFATVMGLLWYIGMVLLLIMIVQYLFGNLMAGAGKTMYNKTLRSLGYGLLYWIGVPALAVIATITLVGVPVAIILVGVYIMLFLIASVIISVVLAGWIAGNAASPWSYWKKVFAAFALFIVVKLISFTPFLGRFIWAVLACIAFGAIAQNINWLKKRKSPPKPAGQNPALSPSITIA
jgi:hypothetical protein